MKSAVFEKLGLPWEVLEIQERPLPQPGPGEVRVRVTACNINPSDIMYIQGLYGIRPEIPGVGGFEATGVVDECGEGVQMPQGMRVIFTGLGVWAEYIVVSAKTLIPAPEGMSDEVACQAFVNPFTAYAMLESAKLSEGQTLLLTAGGSAFSKFVTQMAASKGISVISTVRRDGASEGLLQLGAKAVINTEKESLPKAIKSLTDGKGVDVAFDAVGSQTGADALASLTEGGTMWVYGLLSLQPIPLNSGLMIFKDLTVKGFWLSSWMARLPKERRMQVVGEVLGMLGQEQLKVEIEKTYSIDEIKEAVKHADTPGRTGKIILKLE